MKITLIAPPWIFRGDVEFVSQNLGPRYLISYLEERGHEVAFIDAFTGGLEKSVPIHTKYADALRWGLSDAETVRRIPRDTELIGISAPFTDSRFIVNPLSHHVRAVFPNVTQVMGGVYPSTLPEEALRKSAVDLVVIGEGETTLSKIAQGCDLNDVRGIAFWRDGKIVRTGPGEVIRDSARIASPTLDLPEMEQYVRWSPWGNRADRTLALLTSRGCPFNCTFCSIHHVYGRQWRAFTPERVATEIQEAVDKLDITHIEFMDDNLILKRKRAMEIFARMNRIRTQGGGQLAWSAPNGIMIECADRETIFAMKGSGAEVVYLPVESGDQRILKAMRKPRANIHLEKTLEAARWCAEAGLRTSAFMIVAYPGEDRESFETTKRFCCKLLKAGVTAITPLVATPYPNTPLHNLCEEKGWLVHKDSEHVLVYQRYSDFLPEFVLIETPWCSRKEAFLRYQEMMREFPTQHNIRKL